MNHGKLHAGIPSAFKRLPYRSAFTFALPAALGYDLARARRGGAHKTPQRRRPARP